MRSATKLQSGRERGLLGSLGWVAAGSMAANLAAYVVYLGASQWLGPGDFGQFARLLSAMLILGVPALALQSVIAREVVRGADIARMRALTTQTTEVVTAALVIAVPVVVWILRVSFNSALAALCTAPLLVVIAGAQGVLQGAGEFRGLAWVLALVGAARTVPVIIALAVGAGPAGALWAGTAGAAVAAAAAWVVVVAATRPTGTSGSTAGADAAGTTVGSVLRASQVQLVLVVAVSVDLLLSGTVLDDAGAGVYALGAIATKAAFWLPQAIGVVFYPRLADAARSRASLRQALLVVAGIGVTLTALAALIGPLIPWVLGEEYRPVVPIAWLFTYTGAAMAVLQVLLLAAIAADRTRVALITWCVVIAEVIVIVTAVHSVAVLAATAAVSVTIAAALTAIAARSAVRYVHRDHADNSQP